MLAPMARGARRPAGAARGRAVALGTLVPVLLMTACGGVGEPASYDATGIDGLEIPTPSPDPADFVDAVDNAWFPLRAGDTQRYVIEEDGERVGSVRVDVLRPAVVAGVDATAVRIRTRVAGDDPVSVTRYYAQDDAGNVWLLGEDAAPATWRAGEGGAEGGVVMPAEPRVGDGWVSASVPGVGQRVVRVVPAVADASDDSTLEGVWLSESDASGARTRHVYAPDVGLVESVVLEGSMEGTTEGTTAGGRTTTLVGDPR